MVTEQGATPPALAGIIPRWEWRTFGTRFGAADATFAAMSSTGIVCVITPIDDALVIQITSFSPAARSFSY